MLTFNEIRIQKVTNTYKKKVPLVLQISKRFTTFSCFRSCRILISLKAVRGNWKNEKRKKTSDLRKVVSITACYIQKIFTM